jgi:hypothetical protein
VAKIAVHRQTLDFANKDLGPPTYYISVPKRSLPPPKIVNLLKNLSTISCERLQNEAGEPPGNPRMVAGNF